MTAAHKEALERHRVTISDLLEPTFLIAYLQQKDILNQYDKDMLNSENNRSLKNRHLIDILLKKSDLAYYQFVHGLLHLEPSQAHIVKLLEPGNLHSYFSAILEITNVHLCRKSLSCGGCQCKTV